VASWCLGQQSAVVRMTRKGLGCEHRFYPMRPSHHAKTDPIFLSKSFQVSSSTPRELISERISHRWHLHRLCKPLLTSSLLLCLLLYSVFDFPSSNITTLELLIINQKTHSYGSPPRALARSIPCPSWQCECLLWEI